MNGRLRVLLIEDSEDDTFLLLRALKKGGIEPYYRVVDSESAMEAALMEETWDMVITDHSLPGFTSFRVLELSRQYAPELPVIIVSGLIGEDVAVSAMKAGAQDYIMKDNLSRLIPAINREMREVSIRLAKKRAESTLEHMAYHDSLTDLVNRREFERQLVQSLHDSRKSARECVLLYLDLDQFKIINDTCGHMAGDELLKQLSKVLGQRLRTSDTLARLGGDEFGVLLRNCDVVDARKVAENLCKEVREYRFVWEDKPFAVSLSVGMVIMGSNYKTASELLSHADLACYAAKDRGRDNVQVYETSDLNMQQRQRDMHWTSRLQSALQTNDFFLYHQEMIPLQEASADGFRTEFLVRLRDGDDTVPPGAFIPAAERFGLMPRIDRRVIELAFAYLDRTGLGRESTGTFFINLSGSSLSDGELFHFINSKVQEYSILPTRICFEITETSAIAHLNDTIGFIERARHEGFEFALDDFGTGMSSFTYLKALPIDYLKVDGGFIQNLLDDPIDMGIVDACNRIGHAAGLKTIAEFVESDEVKDCLIKLGFDYAQGYGIKMPVPLNK
ncbi:putative bifunctional diguanylate cyclase/phosphodiesterase [Marinobacter alexandrii]|uniref:putative bifunctional diguanylate cyclase/phosphodiesterase n=1 Tax=Marinobacter alexandrii TaxID=2570351 RepID=UPI0014861116|nr:EAL domain-containing protein [Marinobacter alexandrii]